MSAIQLTDNSKMPYGKYEGVEMINVPASYLLWCYDTDNIRSDVKQYVEMNIKELRKEANDSQIK